MPIDDIKKKKIGRELTEWIFLGVRTGMRRGVEMYEAEKANNLDRAILALKRAVDLPRRAKIRIQEFIQKDPGNLQLIEDSLALYGTVTRAEIQAELDSLEIYAQGLKDAYDGGASYDDIANDITNNIEKESDYWIFKIPDGYTDIWGE
jgi:hypothetical protein